MKHFLYPNRAWLLVCPALLCIFISLNLEAASSDPKSFFTENKGQIVDQFGRQRNDVKFMYVSDRFKLILKSNGFSYELMNQSDPSSVDEATASIDPDDEDEFSSDVQSKVTVSRIDVSLRGCNNYPLIEALEPATFYQNFYNQHTGYKGITGVKSYGKIIYRDIYPNIDLVFTINDHAGKKPEYSFVLHPGSDMQKIQMNYTGAGNKYVDHNGNLCMTIKEGMVYESTPVGYDEDNPDAKVPLSLRIRDNRISFTSKSYDKNRTFTIDPVITWATYYGGPKLDMPDELAISTNNDIFVTVRTESSSSIATTGSFQSTFGGGKDDASLIKFDTNGQLLWATYFGGEKVDLSYCMCIDNTNHPIICGKTNSSFGIASPGAVQPVFGGGEHDSYIAKFNDDGTLVWSTYYGGEKMDRVLACTTDVNGTIYLTGYTESLTQIATPGAFKTTGDIKGETFIMKMTPEGGLEFCTYFGDKGQDRGHGIVIDDKDNIITIGTTTSGKKGIATPGAYQTIYGGSTDMYLNKFTNDGSMIWSTYIGGSKDDRGRACVVDAADNIYIMGQVASTNLFTTPGTLKPVFTPVATNDQDAYIMKFDSSGQVIWATYCGGSSNEQPKSLKIDRYGSFLYLSGSTQSKASLSTGDAYQKTIGGNNDAYLSRINYDASSLMYSTYYGGKASESDFNHTWYGAPMEIDRNGDIILASATRSKDSIAYGNPYKSTLATDTAFDFFLVKFTETCFDSYENEDSISTAPHLFFDGSATLRSVRATLSSSADVDYYQFPLREGFNSIRCTVSGLSEGSSITIFDGNQSPVATASGPPNASSIAILNFAPTGNYYVAVAPAGATFSSPLCYQLDIETSSSAFKTNDDFGTTISNDISIFPNPAFSQVTVSWQNHEADPVILEMMNAAGQLMVRKTLSGDQHSIDLDIDQLPSGSYFISIASNGQRSYEKFIKQ